MAFIEKVRPDNGAREGRYLLAGIVLLILGGLLTLPFNQRDSDHARLDDNQVAAGSLGQAQQMLMAQLQLAHEEIRDLYLESQELDALAQWPGIQDLSDLYLAPFIQDLNWQAMGEHEWQSLGNGLYLGVSPVAGLDYPSVLLDSRESEAPQIWLYPETSVAIESDLEQLGWYQLVFVKTQRQSHHH